MSDRILLASIAVLVAAITVFTCAVTLMFHTGTAGACTVPAAPSEQPGDSVPTYDSEQQTNARAIIDTGAALAIPVRGWIIAIAAALQESGLRNLDHGDPTGPDSRGLFQQRADWGTLRERMDPATAARLFYTGGHAGQPGLLDIPG